MQWKETVPCDEEKILQTISIAKASFYESEAGHELSRWEFLIQQSRYIRKSWWLLQGLLLLAVLTLLCQLQTDTSNYYIQRILGVTGPLFVILTLPELWKNRSFDAMEVESTTYYSLRQIYAARLTLFAGVDLLLLSLFFIGASFTGRVTAWQLMVQFLLPFMVACCICFHCLYSTRNSSAAFSLLLCSLWTGLWMQVVLHKAVYEAISVPVWCLMFSVCVCYLVCCILRGQRKIQRILEVKPLWI